MIARLFAAAAAAALLAGAAPAAAQKFSDSYEFIQAVREPDGPKVQKFLNDKTLRIINTRDRNTGEAAIHIVTNRDDSLYLRVLLQHEDTDPNLQDRQGNTALILAAGRGWQEGVDILLRYEVNVNLVNASGENALIRAVQIHNYGIVEALLKAGADPDRTDNVTGKSARDYAKEATRWPAIAKLLAEAPKVKGMAAGAAGPKL